MSDIAERLKQARENKIRYDANKRRIGDLVAARLAKILSQTLSSIKQVEPRFKAEVKSDSPSKFKIVLPTIPQVVDQIDILTASFMDIPVDFCSAPVGQFNNPGVTIEFIFFNAFKPNKDSMLTVSVETEADIDREMAKAGEWIVERFVNLMLDLPS